LIKKTKQTKKMLKMLENSRQNKVGNVDKLHGLWTG